MTHLPPLIFDLALILVTAGFSILICRKFKLPVVLGYIIAGFLVGPHFPIFPDVHDIKSINAWAEIGVIVLLFTIGLEFSYKKLATVGKSAIIVVLIKTFFICALGYSLGRFFVWSATDSIYLGSILAISSTTIVVRAFEEMGIKRSPFVNFVYAILIVEDLVAIVLLVFLSTMSATKSMTGADLFFILGKLTLFLILCFTLGLYFIPLIIKKFKEFFSEETTLVFSLGLCFLMVIVADLAGFSPALGAFIIGSIFSETAISHNIEKIMNPLKHLFAAIFFVSIGILFDPSVFKDHTWYIIAITLCTVIGKFVSTLLGSIIAGEPLKTSVRSGLTLAQIGEFSFIIATLGITLKATNPVLYPIAVAVCIITSFLTPYFIKQSENVYRYIVQKTPPLILKNLENYSQAVQEQKKSSNFMTLLWELYGLKFLLNATIIISINLFYGKVILPFFNANTKTTVLMESILFGLNLVTTIPFFWPILFGRPTKSLYMETPYETARRLHIGITICRSFIGVLLLSFMIGQYSSLAAASSLLILGSLIIFIPFTRPAGALYRYFERSFMDNLNKDE